MKIEYTLTIYDAITGEITTRPMTEEEIKAMPVTIDTLNKEP